jgi:cystathionine beta-synthase
MFDMGFLRADGLLAADVLNAKGGQLPDLVLVLPDEQVRDAIDVMHETGVSQVVVSVTKELPLAAKEVVGTLRELELMDLTFRDDDVLDQPIADVMSPPMPNVGIGEPVARVVECLEQGPSVLVLEGGHPIGVLTRSDVLSFLAVRTRS